MFLNPEIKNKLIQQKKYMEEMEFNPFVPNVLYDNLMEIDVKKKSKEHQEEIKNLSVKNRSKKNKVEVIKDKVEEVIEDKVDKVDKDKDKDKDKKGKVDKDKKGKVDKDKVPEVPLEKPGVDVDVLDTAELSSDEKNNVKSIIVDPSFF